MDLQRNLTLAGAVQRLKKNRLGIRHAFSIGAGSGGDSEFIQKNLCPDAEMLLIEAQDVHIPNLQKVAQSPGISYEICAAAAEDGVVHFLNSAPTGGVVSQVTQESVAVPARSIDSLAAERGWTGPFFLKFDTHGVELDILAGAEKTLAQTHLVMMEVYNFRLNFVQGKNLMFHEMCQWMERHGLRCVDMCEPLFRPNDGVLWQMHLFFIRADHPVFGSNSYSAPVFNG
ncbi:FkbM family methyltransferase [Magnetospirillum fulvum]|uniref:Methyltransferase, FkbM family n=1 Tax=Magnetospirillum fulvum TaxID=1082 RepID=A0A1H6H872_MAGFU|nr:FkbM family methyltransferase [Magnetospirillum fulvum]SEH30163.1 methyltransferase, FkbM family [Magnetospirillum fulvum]